MSSFQTIDGENGEFTELVLECIDEGMREIFGEMGARLILDYLNREGWLRRPQIAERLEVFKRGLTEFLGSGAAVVEHAVLKILYSRLGEQYRNIEGNNFADCVTELKKSHLRVRMRSERMML